MQCIQCGTKLRPGVRFCTNCGTQQPTPPLPSIRSQQVPSQFAEAERRFAVLGGRCEAGELDDDTYDAELRKLIIRDAAGGYWMLGAESGKWYWYNGRQWVRRNPTPIALRTEGPETPPAPPATGVPPSPAAPPAKAFPWNWVALGCGGMWAAAAILVSALAVFPSLLPFAALPTAESTFPLGPTQPVAVASPHPTQQPAEMPSPTVPMETPTATPEPRFSVSGQILVWVKPDWAFFQDGPHDLYVAHLDGSPQTKVTDESITCGYEPAMSPDGTQFLFVSGQDDDREIYLADVNGSNVLQLTNNQAVDIWPAWSPDGSRIAFNSDRNGNVEIYVMDADGANQTRLTDTPAKEFVATWSPDGTRLAFKSDRDGDMEIYLMNADGSNQTRLTNNQLSDSNPTWSPDGDRIAFISYPDDGAEIYVVNADGTNLARLTDSVGWSSGIWSPDGTQILFDSSHGDGNDEIYLANADGSGLIRLTDNPASDKFPVWSPDGTRIAFLSTRHGISEDVYLMNADGSGLLRLTENLGTEERVIDAIAWLP
jgi:Tol biopolymer transport system component